MGPGEVLTMKFDCCQLILDPVHNGLLKQASPQTVLEAELVSVSNHNNVPLLNTTAFSMQDALWMRVLQRCIARIEDDPAGWVRRRRRIRRVGVVILSRDECLWRYSP